MRGGGYAGGVCGEGEIIHTLRFLEARNCLYKTHKEPIWHKTLSWLKYKSIKKIRLQYRDTFKVDKVIMKEKNKIESYIIWSIICSVVLTLFAPFLATCHGLERLNFMDTGQIGDTIGGTTAPIIGLLNALLLYFTFREQAQFNKKQVKIAKDEQFKSALFSLLQAQREIMKEVESSFTHVDSKNVTHIITDNNKKGKAFFEYASQYISRVFEALEQDTYYGIPFDSDYLGMAADKEKELEDEASERGINAINVPDEVLKAYEQACAKARLPFRLNYINHRYDINKAAHSFYHSAIDVSQKIAIAYHFFYRKHYSVGSYFRHLYHILKFIKNSEEEMVNVFGNNSEKEREIRNQFKGYAKLVQAQMSDEELKLLFYDSFLFPKLQKFLLHYGILENLCIEDLYKREHDCVSQFHLKSRNKEVADILNAIIDAKK